ncbi:TAP-like protein-domain-containing protein [Mycena vulgaris]|nr:TAP-like protein-domain-containing protein [Mycena vulgaris]
MLSCSFLLFPALYLSSALAASEFNWQTVKPSTKLTWTPCYEGFQCARLQTTPPQYRGPLLFNPGGPGGSGVDAVVGSGAAFATVFGPQFDIVGFDPRGVSYSTPAISFFKTDVERELLIPSAASIVYPSLNASSTALNQEWAHWQLVGQLAAARNNGDYLRHMTTDNVARDMLRITEAFGYEKLQYWGISYGSVLGAMFASLFPVIGRLIIDGVFDMDAYYSANLTPQMADTDKTLQTFFDGCATAGPTDCAFHAPSASAISRNLDTLTASIRDQPLAVVTPTSHGIVDFVFLLNAVLNALYVPYDAFASLAQGLTDLAAGNATTLYAQSAVPTFECACNASAVPFHLNNLEAYMAVACGDATPVEDSIPHLQRYYEDGLKMSSFADLLSSTRVLCSGWKIHREGRFRGPVGAQNTSFPLLVVGNTFDPVTPLAGAAKTAKSFPGSALLTQDSIGHTTFTTPSLCTFAYFRAYFVNGTLPAPGTVCAVDTPLFPPSSSGAARKRDAEAEELLEAGRTIRGVVRRIAGRRAL